MEQTLWTVIELIFYLTKGLIFRIIIRYNDNDHDNSVFYRLQIPLIKKAYANKDTDTCNVLDERTTQFYLQKMGRPVRWYCLTIALGKRSNQVHLIASFCQTRLTYPVKQSFDFFLFGRQKPYFDLGRWRKFVGQWINENSYCWTGEICSSPGQIMHS